MYNRLILIPSAGTSGSSLLAGMFNFAPAQMLEAAKPEAREAPKVSFT